TRRRPTSSSAVFQRRFRWSWVSYQGSVRTPNLLARFPTLTSITIPKEPMKSLNDLRIQLYADGADKAGILDLYAKPYIKGLTTNPSLMKKAGIKDYEAFAKDILQTVTAKPISLEVFSDEFSEMRRQAAKISALAKNVYVKIPITNSVGVSCIPLIKELSAHGVKL